MKPDEAKVLQSLGTKVFLRSLEAPFITKPETAYVVVVNDTIAGGFIYNISSSTGKKLAVVDYFFIDPKLAGKGIGSKLCQAGMAHLWDEGCDFIAAFVRDDNIASWSSFEKAGLRRISVLEATKHVGISGIFRCLFYHLFSFFIGCDFYLASKDGKPDPIRKESGLNQLFRSGIYNMLLIVVITLNIVRFFVDRDFIPSLDNIATAVIAFLVVFSAVTISSYLPTLFSREKYKYRMTDGGFIMSILAALFTMYIPISGNWFPQNYNKSGKNVTMLLTALLPWLLLLILGLALHGETNDILGVIFNISRILLFFRCIPFLSANLGSSRVYTFSKILWMIMAVITAGLLIFIQ